MIGEACDSHKPCDAIVVHSLSRFFRDQISLCNYERKLRKNGVALISISQLTADDQSGEMTRRVIAMFDEFSSLENAKHNLAGYERKCPSGLPQWLTATIRLWVGRDGRKKNKKRLILDSEEAEVVRQIFSLYLEGSGGLKGVASDLNGKELLRRGCAWSTTAIHHVLNNVIYRGERIFNQHHFKSGEEKPEEEWVRAEIEAIIAPEIFDLVAKKLKSRSPAMSNPRLTSSRRLLTMVLKCGICGANMILATGKQNRYRYYKCSTRIKKHLGLCSSKAAPMEKLDQAVLEALADKVFTPVRVAAMLAELKQQMAGDKPVSIQDLLKQLEAVRYRLANIYKSIEMGVELDEQFRENLNGLKKLEADVASRIAGYEHSPQAMVDSIDKEEVASFCILLRERLLDTSKPFSKEYLQLLVKEIVLNGDSVRIKGGYASLAGAIKFTAQKKKLSTPGEVLNSNSDWRPLVDSNRI